MCLSCVRGLSVCACVCLCRKCARQALAVAAEVAVATMSRITLTTLTHTGGGGSSNSNNNSNNDTRTGTLTHLMEEHQHQHLDSGRVPSAGGPAGLLSDGAERLRRQGSRLQTSRFACMRCCGNFLTYLVRLRSTPEELEQRYKSKEIDRFLEKEKHTFRRQVSPLVNRHQPRSVYHFHIPFN